MSAHPRRWLILAVLCLSLLMVVIDNTIVNVALPTLSTELDASTTELQWIVDAYTLVFSALLLAFGHFGDRFGRKLALQLGLVIFALTSVLAALATTATQLIASRALMGVGSALVFPPPSRSSSTSSPTASSARWPSGSGRPPPASPWRWAPSPAATSSITSRGVRSSS